MSKKNTGGRPAKYGEVTHRMSMRIPNSVYIKLLKVAQAEQKNASEVIVDTLKERFGLSD